MSKLVELNALEALDNMEMEVKKLQDSGEDVTPEQRIVIARNFRKAKKEYKGIKVKRGRTKGFQYTCPECGVFLRDRNNFKCTHCFIEIIFTN